MGVCASKEVVEQANKNKQIEKQIVEDKRAKKIKLLLLGTAECGKSTILKQMRILHDHGFSEDEVKGVRYVVYMNVVISMHAMVQAAETFGLPYSNNDSHNHADKIRSIVDEQREREPIGSELKHILHELWADKTIQECYERRSEFHMIDSAKYFLDDLERLASADYSPNEQDMLYLRIPTNGIVEVKFNIKGVLFRVFDVGGQRSERRKWIHCFDDVNAIIFITAVSEFDQTLEEDGKTNRAAESLDLFMQICNSKWFPIKVSMILFLNKTDLFAEKITRVSIKVAFPEYTGSQDYEESLNYIEEEFKKVNQNPKKKIYSHQTCATNKDQVQMVLDSVIDTIMQLNLQNAGMI